MVTSYYFWGTLNSGFNKREGKDGLLMHPLISIVFSLFSLPLSFFLSLRPFYSQFLTAILPQVSLLFTTLFSIFTIFFPQVPSLSASFPSVLTAFLPQALPSSSMAISPFYSELIEWDFSLLPLRFHQLFLVCYGHSFRTTHQPIDGPTTTTTHFMKKLPFVCSYYKSFPLDSNG